MSIVVPTARGPVEILRPADLAERGVSEAIARRRIADGVWTRLRPGYLVMQPERAFYQETWHALRVYASADAHIDECVVSHWSAALIHGLALYEVLPRPVALTRPAVRNRSKESGDTRVYAAALSDAEIVKKRGLRVTSVERTLLDLCRNVEFESGVVAVDSALHASLTSENLLSEAESSAYMRKGVRRFAAALRAARSESESPLETVSRLTFPRFGVPQPLLQFPIRDENGRVLVRGDFYWEDERVIGEADGRGKYRDSTGAPSLSKFEAEKAREARLRDLGFEVIRWGFDDLADPVEWAARLNRRLEMRRRRAG